MSAKCVVLTFENSLWFFFSVSLASEHHGTGESFSGLVSWIFFFFLNQVVSGSLDNSVLCRRYSLFWSLWGGLTGTVYPSVSRGSP